MFHNFDVGGHKKGKHSNANQSGRHKIRMTNVSKTASTFTYSRNSIMSNTVLSIEMSLRKNTPTVRRINIVMGLYL